MFIIDTDPSDCILEDVPAYHDFDDISVSYVYNTFLQAYRDDSLTS